MKTIKLVQSIWQVAENMVGGFLRLERLAPGGVPFETMDTMHARVSAGRRIWMFDSSASPTFLHHA